MEEGLSLTGTIERLADRFGTNATVLPATNDPVSSVIVSSRGEEIHFQDYWVNRDRDLEIESIYYRGIEEASITPKVRTVLNNPVVIGPSNPVTSIGPILAIEPFRKLLEQTFVLGVSPFVGNTVFSGPAGELLEAQGHEASTRGWYEYLDCLDAVLLDYEDPTDLPLNVHRNKLEMNSRKDSRALAEVILEILETRTRA